MVKKTKSKLRNAAVLTIRRPGEMTAQGRRDIAKWLRRSAFDLIKHGKDYTPSTYRGYYSY